MRTSSLVTISLPPALLQESEKIAKKQHMTRSELLRTALRHYLEGLELSDSIKTADQEISQGKSKVLPSGGLAQLIKK